MFRRNSTAAPGSDASFRELHGSFGGLYGPPQSPMGFAPQPSSQQHFSSFGDSNGYSRANATLPPIRPASTVPSSSSHFTSGSSSNSFRPPSRPASPAGSFRNLSLSSGPSSPSNPYYGSPNSMMSPSYSSAPRSFAAPQFGRRSSEGQATLQPSPALVPEKKKLRAKRKAAPDCCHVCGVADTPEWRRGPTGLRTLCNGCGLQAAKLFPNAEPKSVDEALSMLESIGRARFRAFNYVLPSGAKERATKTFSAGFDSSPTSGTKGNPLASDTFEAALSLEALSRTNQASGFTSPASSISSSSSNSVGVAFPAAPSMNRRSSFGQPQPQQAPPPPRSRTPSSFQQPQARNRMDLSHLVSPPSRPSSRQERRSSFTFNGSFKF